MAAVLRCGPEAVLSHGSAGALLGILAPGRERIEVSVPARVARSPGGILVYRRAALRPCDIAPRDGIPATSPVVTLVDLATCLQPKHLERAINEADRLDLITPDKLRQELDGLPSRHGLRTLREMLKRPGFTLTESELERSFLPIAHRAGLDTPLTRQWLNGWRVDFYWPDLGLVVETDGLRYHRTAFQQERDRLRDQAHAAAGLTSLRFTHGQIAFRPNYVEETLVTVVRRLRDNS
jgi:very-short-patch-repair endonuclease